MKITVKTHQPIIILGSLAILASIVAACAPAGAIANPTSEKPAAVMMEVPTTPAPEPTAQAENAYGLTVVAQSLCTDGVNTTLLLQTELNPAFWQLGENDFYPQGKTYFETSVLLLENNTLYSSVSSGQREPPVFDEPHNRVSTTQSFVFPKTPRPNAQFTLKANVTLAALPFAYVPPVGASFIAPGIIEVPSVYVTAVPLTACP